MAQNITAIFLMTLMHDRFDDEELIEISDTLDGTGDAGEDEPGSILSGIADGRPLLRGFIDVILDA